MPQNTTSSEDRDIASANSLGIYCLTEIIERLDGELTDANDKIDSQEDEIADLKNEIRELKD